ncbi:protoporphyrinogen oxidase isoform X2 [Palaemon carinicauda]|uniref:protoporphyrinogen oxidase isoform X2 n=1 Tax=Palaemon carinicauda TaxID=392227 RepID=UPI0035B62CD2
MYPHRSMSVAVLGGGVSGLAAAHYLKLVNPTSQVILLEASHRLGGWIKSTTFDDGITYEEGPRTLRVVGNAGANTLVLAESLGLTEKIIKVDYSHPSAKNRMIRVDGQLHKLPNSLKTALKKLPPFSKPLAISALSDFRAKKVHNTDESLYSFVNRRFGSEVAKYAIDPLARGVFAGNARELSVKSLAKRLHEVEQSHGSVLLGMFRDRKNSEKSDPELLKSELVQKARSEKWAVWSLKGGLETLVTTLAQKVEDSGVDILRNTPVTNIWQSGPKLIVGTDKKQIEVDRVISCLPSNHLSSALEHTHKNLFKLLKSIPYATVGVVTLEYPGQLLKEVAFGYLVPSSEPCKVLGVIFDTCTFPQGNRTIFTVMMGGYWFKEFFGENPSQESLLDLAQSEVRKMLKINELPVRFSVNILRDCIPQYVVGHSEAVYNARRLIKEQNIPLTLAGNSYDGVGVNDAIMSAKRAVLSQ